MVVSEEHRVWSMEYLQDVHDIMIQNESFSHSEDGAVTDFQGRRFILRGCEERVIWTDSNQVFLCNIQGKTVERFTCRS